MNRVNIILSYLKHLWVANNRHGIHSPFVYQFLDEILYAKTTDKLSNLKKLKQQLLNDRRPIKITDLGAGSTINKKATRLVKDIAQHSSKNEKYGKLFYLSLIHI